MTFLHPCLYLSLIDRLYLRQSLPYTRQTIMSVSTEPVARPLEPHVAEVTAPRWPEYTLLMLLLMSHTRTLLSAEAVARRLVLPGSQAMPFTAPSCGRLCRVVPVAGS